MRILLLLVGPALVMGCAGYQIGQKTLYQPDIRSVHVPIFESVSFRRNLAERLTEAVVREIESNTPYKIVSRSSADSQLTGKIIAETKDPIAENATDYPRVIETRLVAYVEWRRSNGEPLGRNAPLQIPFALRAAEASQFIPEAGQSVATAHQDTIEKIARDIVAQMEMPW